MMLLLFAAIGIIAGLICGGSFRGFGRYALSGVLLPVAAYLLKALAARLLVPQTGAVLVSLLQYNLLFGFLLSNHRRPIWPLFAFAGTLMNFLVIVLNGGCMPVSAAALGVGSERLARLAEGRIYAYCLQDGTTRLSMLGDIIRLGTPNMPLGYASIGDVVLCIGVGILFWQMMRAGKKQDSGDTKPQSEPENAFKIRS